MMDDYSLNSESLASSTTTTLPSLVNDSKVNDTLLKKKFYEVDYVGNGSFQVSQLSLLNKRSLEPIKTMDGLLSSRGLHHRSRDVFVKEAKSQSHIIQGLMRGEKVRSAKYKPSAQLFQPHFQRALAYERLSQIDKAIADYTVCIAVNDHNAASYFNRGGLYRVRKNFSAALVDMNKAVSLDPANIDYRTNRALLCREMNEFDIAAKDTIITRALQRQPELKRTLELGGDLRMLENDAMYSTKIAPDPIMAALQLPGDMRMESDLLPIKDFLRSLKVFASFSNNMDVLSQIAAKVELQTFKKTEMIFEEGQIGLHFYLILDGEVAILRLKKTGGEDALESTLLVKLFRGQSFGETALESKGGLRTAGAMATQDTCLLALQADEYQKILHRFSSGLKEEVRIILASSALFSDWAQSKIDYLASFVVHRSFGANTEIMKAGEPVPCLMLIKSGMVTLIKSMPRPAHLRSLATHSGTGSSHTRLLPSDSQHEIPGMWVTHKSWNNHLDVDYLQEAAVKHEHERSLAASAALLSSSSNHHDDNEHNHDNNRSNNNNSSSNIHGKTGLEMVEFAVGVLGSGQVFGELAVLDPQHPSPLTAMSSTAVELYCFEAEVLMALNARFTASTMKVLMESITLHDPPADKIAYFYRQKYDWELRKKALMARLRHQKTSK